MFCVCVVYVHREKVSGDRPKLVAYMLITTLFEREGFLEKFVDPDQHQAVRRNFGQRRSDLVTDIEAVIARDGELAPKRPETEGRLEWLQDYRHLGNVRILSQIALFEDS